MKYIVYTNTDASGIYFPVFRRHIFCCKVMMKSEQTLQPKNYLVQATRSTGSHDVSLSPSELEVYFLNFLSDCGTGVYFDPFCGYSPAVDSNSN
jgi:hypothetical protein